MDWKLLRERLGRVAHVFLLVSIVCTASAISLFGASIYTARLSPALAACTSFAPASNSTVDCTGASTQGVIANSSTGVTIGVHTGGSIVPAANGALDPTHVNWGIDVGSGASITIDNGGTVDTSGLSSVSIVQSAILLNSGSALTINGTVKGGSGVVGTVATALGSGFANSTINVGSTGQVIATQPTFGNTAALNGSGGGNTFQIDGLVQALGAGGSGIFVGTGDKVTLSATGHIQSLGTANGGGVYNTAASNVVVTTAAGSLIESHNASGVSSAIGLGTNVNVTAGGAIHVYPGSGGGIQVGAGSTVWLQSTGSIVNDAPPSAFTVGGQGISAGNGSTVTVDGTVSTGQGTAVRVGNDSQLTINNNVTVANGTNGSAFGASFGIGSTVTVTKNATITSSGTGTSRYAAALGSEVSTSVADHTVTIDIFGRVEHTGTGTASGIYLEGANNSASPVSVTANITIEVGGSVYSQAGAAYSELDGCCGYPDVAANIIIAGDVETGVVGGKVLDLNDGADTVTFLPTYHLVGSIDGGSDQSSSPTGPEIDTLAFDGAANTSGTFDFGANQVVNFEAGHKTGAGTWVLNGTTTGIAGTFTVDAGRLSVNGTMTSTSFTVASGGTLAGIGTLGATTILAGGAHAPGNSIGTQAINGNYANHGTLQIEVSPTLADKLIVNGAVDITGATLALTESPAAGWDPTRDYTIIDNDGVDAVTGTFAGVSDNFAFLDPTVVTNGGSGNDVVLTVVRNSVAFATVALTPNETAAANGAQSLGGGNPVYDAIVPLTTAAAPNAFDQLSGEIYATLAGAELTDSRIPREAALDRVDAEFAALAADKQKHGRNIWTRMVGDVGVVNGDGNAAAALTSTGGFMFGADEWLSNTLLLGSEAGVTFAGISVPDRNSTGSIDSVHLGVYGGADLEPLQLSFGATLSGHGAHVTRTPAFAGFTETLDSDSAGLTAQLFGEIGYAFKGDAGTIEPFAGLALVHEESGAYAETGGAGALSGKAASIDAALLTVGVKTSTELALPGDVKARAKALLGWQGTLAGTPTATHSFVGGTPFTVAGAPLDSHLILDTDVEFDLPGTAKLDLGYHGALGAGGGHSAVLATLGGTF